MGNIMTDIIRYATVNAADEEVEEYDRYDEAMNAAEANAERDGRPWAVISVEYARGDTGLVYTTIDGGTTATLTWPPELASVRIVNSYACGRTTEGVVEVRVPRNGEDVERWWGEVVYPYTGDAHPCGAIEHARHEVTVTECKARPDLVGQTTSWEG